MSFARYAVLTLFLAAGLVAPALAQQTRTYAAQGTNGDGSAYGGTVAIQQTGAASYRVRWQVGNATIDGIGMTAGNIFTAAYMLDRQVGLVIYQLMPDGRLTGQWTLSGSAGVGTEVLTPR